MIKTTLHIALVLCIFIFCTGGPAGFTMIFNAVTGLQVQDGIHTWVLSIGLMVCLLALAKKDDNVQHTQD